ncbi:MAG: hypothetical protein Q7R90_01140 [bacterium]|nr:hypothetical protein [bacterium]
MDRTEMDVIKLVDGLAAKVREHSASGPFQLRLVRDGNRAIVNLYDARNNLLAPYDLGPIS